MTITAHEITAALNRRTGRVNTKRTRYDGPLINADSMRDAILRVLGDGEMRRSCDIHDRIGYSLGAVSKMLGDLADEGCIRRVCRGSWRINRI